MSGSLASMTSRPRWRHVEVDEVLAADAPAIAHLHVDGAADHVARRQLHESRRVALHEALAGVVDEVAALAARGLGQEDADAHDAGRVELVELHVLERHTAPIGQRHAVAGQRVGVRGDPEHAPVAARGQQRGGCPEDVQLAVRDPIGDDAARDRPAGAGAVDEQVDDVVLVEEGDLVLDALLVERLQDHVAGAIGGEARPTDGALPEVAGMAAEAPLVDAPVVRPIEGQAHVLELDDTSRWPREPGSRRRPGRRGSRRP